MAGKLRAHHAAASPHFTGERRSVAPFFGPRADETRAHCWSMDLEARVKALEDLLSLPSDAAARNPQSDVLADKVATLEAGPSSCGGRGPAMHAHAALLGGCASPAPARACPARRAALAKANYRIKHLAAAYEAKAAEVEALKRAGTAGAASKTA